MLYVQKLVHEDFDRKIEFCELIEARENDFINNIAKLISNFIGILIVKISDKASKIHIG